MQPHTFSQANATILTGFHSASLRHSFTSVAFSPPAAYYLARRPPTSAAFTLRMLIAHSYLISQSSAKVHLHSSATFVPFGKFTAVASYGAGIAAATWLSFFTLPRKVAAALLTSPFVGLAGTSVRSSLQCLMAARHQRYSADKCAARLCFFFAAGAFTGRQTHICQPFHESTIELRNKFIRCIGRIYPGFIKPAVNTLILSYESSNNF